MSKRPDYGDATPEDLARALIRTKSASWYARRKASRYQQSDPDTSDCAFYLFIRAPRT